MTNRTTEQRALQLAKTRHRIAHQAYGATPDWDGFNPVEKALFVEEAAVWLRAAVEAGLVDRPASRRDAIDQAAQQQRVARARHEGAIEALRSAAEHMSIGAAIGPVPYGVRSAVGAWLCQLAEHRLNRARKDAQHIAAATVGPDAASAPSGVAVSAAQGSSTSESAQSPAGAPEGALRDSGADAARIALTRSDLAALLAHHAELLDNIWTFSLEQQQGEDLAGPDGEALTPPRRTLTPNEYSAAWHAVEGAAGEEGADPATVLHAVLNRLGIDTPPAEETAR